MSNRQNVVYEYADAISRVSRKATSEVLELLEIDSSREEVIYLLLMMFSLILTYRKMAIEKVGFFKLKKIVKEIIESLAWQTDAQHFTDRYHNIFAQTNKAYGFLPAVGEDPKGTLLWEYSQYIIEKSQIAEKKDFFKTVEVSRLLLMMNEDLRINDFVRYIK